MQEAEDAKLLAERQKQREDERLQRAADELRIKEAERQKKEAEAKRIAQEAFMLEQENKRILDELLRKPEIIPDVTEKFVPRNENLGLDPVIRGKGAADHDTEGRLRLFNRTNAGTQSDYNAPIDIVEQPQEEYKIPREFEITNGLLNPRVFSALFGEDHKFPFVLRPSDSTLGANGFYWKLEGMFSARDWTHGIQCWIEWDSISGYVLRTPVRLTQTINVTPVGINELVKFSPLPPEPDVTTIDHDEDILMETQSNA